MFWRGRTRAQGFASARLRHLSARRGRLAALALAACLALGAATQVTLSSALFDDAANVTGNTFTSDTLAPPTGFSTTGGPGQINLTWTPTVSTYADGYFIYRATASAGPYTKIGTAAGQATTGYADTTAAAGTTYWYQVRSYRVNWLSGTTIVSSNAATATWTQMNAGYQRSCGIKQSGMGYCWGGDGGTYGSIGDGSGYQQSSPSPLAAGTNWTTVNAGAGDTGCGIASSIAYCWGRNQYGQIGDTTTTNHSVPTAVAGGSTWTAISAGKTTSCGIKSDQTAWCWGTGGSGQLGNGAFTTSTATPVKVVGSQTWSQIVTGTDTTCAINTAGAAYCWGNYLYVGSNASTNINSPAPLGGGGVYTSITGFSNHFCGIRSDQTAWCWGDNYYGGAGNNTSGNTLSVPAQVSGGYTWSAISAGDRHTCGITTGQVAYCWGLNSNNQLGDGTATNRLVPTAVSGGGAWSSISAGWTHSCGVATSGAGYCWGDDNAGELGDGTGTTVATTPNLVAIPASWSVATAGYALTCGAKDTGAGYCWGNNTYQAVDGTGTNKSSPVAIAGSNSWSSLTAGHWHVCGIARDSTGWCWGGNGNGQLGDGTTTQHTAPAVISGNATWQQLSAGDAITCGIQSDQTAWCWGQNNLGQVGDGTTTQRTTPVQVSPGTTWKEISVALDHVCAIKSDDSLWCWGSQQLDMLANGATTGNASTPQATSQLGATTWKHVTASAYHTCAIKSDDTAWCWGEDSNGQLGNNTVTSYSAPAQVNGGGTWTSLATGQQNTCGIKTGGTLFCWGDNSASQIGDSTTTNRLVPTQTSGIQGYSSVTAGSLFECALRTNGTLWCWGGNGSGQLGLNDTTNRAVPTKVS